MSEEEVLSVNESLLCFKKEVNKVYLAFDIGGTFIKYGILDDNGNIIEKSKIPTINDREILLDSLKKIYLKSKKHKLKGIAMSVPGLVDVKKGIMHTSGAITSLTGIHMVEELSSICDNIKVSIENDGKAAALAEVWVGAAKDVQNCCVLVFGTGIAGSTILNRKVVRGNHLIAGEASWYPIAYNSKENDVKCFMEYSTYGIVRRVEVELNKDKDCMSGEDVFRLYEEGNEIVTEIMKDWFYTIAVQCYNLSTIIDPDIICIGGGVSANPSFINGIKNAVHEIYTLNKYGESFGFIEPKVVNCKYNNDSNLIGAVFNFKQIYEL